MLIFDEQSQNKLLLKKVNELQKSISTQSNNPYSAFNVEFDKDLFRLVLQYNFNFDAISLQLYYKFPQYNYKISRKSVQYRWYQISRKNQNYQKIEILQNKLKLKQKIEISQLKSKNQENYVEQVCNDRYKLALDVAQELDEDQQSTFLLYRPKFICDSEFKLQRESCDRSRLTALINNQIFLEFGQFQHQKAYPQQTAAAIPKQIPNVHLKYLSTSESSPQINGEDYDSKYKNDEEYLDGDYEDYESD